MNRFVLLGCILCLGLIGCATSSNVFVLVPDNEGHVGAIVVSNEQGSQTLSKSNESVTVAKPTAPPSAVAVMAQADTQEVFADVLAVEPAPPAKFTLHFKTDSSDLDADSAQVVDRVMEEVKNRESRDISVNGHTDRSGNEEYNMKLSIRRAGRVRELLVEGGVDPKHISIDSHGEGNPVVPTEDGVSEPRNRRVEVIVR